MPKAQTAKKIEETTETSSRRWMTYSLIVIGLIAAGLLMFIKLGSLNHGVSHNELAIAVKPDGWHGIYHNPLFMPLKVLRSAVYKYFAPLSQSLIRLPNALLGFLTIIGMFLTLLFWYGKRTAIATIVLFATSAWVLHVSRVASYNTAYLAGITGVLLANAIMSKKFKNPVVYSLVNLMLAFIIYIPGMIWFILASLIFKRNEFIIGFKKQTKTWQKIIYIVTGIIWLPLLVDYFIRFPKTVMSWAYIPSPLPSIGTYLGHLGNIFVHLAVMGPKFPEFWLGRLPVLDLLSLFAAVIGIYYYARHAGSQRSKFLLTMSVIAILVTALGSPVNLNFIIPIVYIFVAAGIAFLLKQWFSVFPFNPIARGVGYFLIGCAILTASAYNLRSYFQAWPNNPTVAKVFDVHR